MKRVVREGVFETNSSSTHSVVFKKKKGNAPDKDASYELHSPFAKTMFLIGICNQADRYTDYDFDNETTHTIEVVNEETWDIEEQTITTLSYKGICEKFKNTVIEEYLKLCNVTQEEFEKQFNESIFTCDGECFCRNFFDDDVLNDCTCPFDTFYGICKTLKLNELVDDEAYVKKAQEFLSNRYKFVLQEYWNGFFLVGDKDIY